jgi:hypothetical protein
MLGVLSSMQQLPVILSATVCAHSSGAAPLLSLCLTTPYTPAGQQPPEGERKLYLLIEAPTEAMVKRAKQEIRRVIEELVEKAMRRDVGAGQRGRYNIM